MPMASRILIIANTHKDGVSELAERMTAQLEAEGRTVRCFRFARKPEARPDFAGIDLAIDQGRLPLTGRSLLSVGVERAGQTVAEFTACNDAVVSGMGPAKLIYLDVQAGAVSLGTYRCDGVIVATPTGSTAYSMAAGGPVLQPDMSAILFTPICPFTLSNRPLVLPGDAQVAVRVASGQREATVLTVDGQESFGLLEGDTVRCREAARRVGLYGAGREAFYHVLRAKLNWSGGPDA